MKTKNKYTTEQKLELKKYMKIVEKDKKFKALYEIVNSATSSKSEKIISVQEVALSVGYPAYKINYWLKRYLEEGITGIINYEHVVKQFLKQCGKPISKWTKHDLYHRLTEVGVKIEDEKIIIHNLDHGEKIIVPRSETFFWNILNKMKDWPNADKIDAINEIYVKRKDSDLQILYVDYLMIQREPMQPFVEDVLYFIVVSNDILELIPIKVGRRNNKWLKPQVNGFSKILDHIKTFEYEKTVIILNDTEINRVIAEIFSTEERGVFVATGGGKNIVKGIQDGLKYLNDIKGELEKDMNILERASTRYSFIEKNRKKYEEIKNI